MFRHCCFFAVCILLVQMPRAFSKEWSDKSGAYQFEATLIAFDQENVVLKSTDKERMNGHELISIPRKELSAADQEYLSSKEAAELTSQLDKTKLPELKDLEKWIMSSQASFQAMARNPGYVVGPVKKISRRR